MGAEPAALKNTSTACGQLASASQFLGYCSAFFYALSSLFQVNHRTELHLAQDKDYGTTKHLNTIESKKSFHRPVQKFGLVSALHLSIKTRLEEGRLLTSCSNKLRLVFRVKLPFSILVHCLPKSQSTHNPDQVSKNTIVVMGTLNIDIII